MLTTRGSVVPVWVKKVLLTEMLDSSMPMLGTAVLALKGAVPFKLKVSSATGRLKSVTPVVAAHWYVTLP